MVSDHELNFLAVIIALFKYKRYVETSKKAQFILDETMRKFQAKNEK